MFAFESEWSLEVYLQSNSRLTLFCFVVVMIIFYNDIVEEASKLEVDLNQVKHTKSRLESELKGM